MPCPSPPSKVLIVGTGEFGVATALSLVEGPYQGKGHLITLLDRSADPPSLDAASSDLNKIVRQDYADNIYAPLAHEACNLWRTSPLYSRSYFESGILVASKPDHPTSDYVLESFQQNQKRSMFVTGKKARRLEGVGEVKRCFPDGVEVGELDGHLAYFNEVGGWAFARQAVVDLISHLRTLGVQFQQGTVSSLIHKDKNGIKDITGVECSDGKTYEGDLVILTVGSWTPVLVRELGKNENLVPTGQVLATIQLTDEEAERYRKVPVVLDLSTGFYCFPPNEDNIVKFAIHGAGYLNPSTELGLPSVPRTTLTPGCEKDQIPLSAQQELLAGLQTVYPELAKKGWTGSRLCWYSDRKSGDWLIDYHPSYPSLFLATGCSGHAFKFLPVIGSLILSGISGKLTAGQQEIWSFNHSDPAKADGSRFASPKLLKVEEMIKF
ncbi:FAD dependent oxidoreductase [Meredithblackwellia eburnea MCA 4105]